MHDPAIPPIAEIESSRDIVSAPDASAKVVRVGESIVAKYGGAVSLVEAKTMEYLMVNSAIPVPKMYATHTDPSTGSNYLVMEYIPGQTLQQAWATLTDVEMLNVTRQLKEILVRLRNLPPPGYIGSVCQQPCADGMFWHPKPNPLITGPFSTEKDMNRSLVERLRAREEDAFVRFLEPKVSSILHGHRIVFTHGDLQPKNIMITDTGRKAGAARELRVTLIDWEEAGWYPEYWEYSKATISGRFKSPWLDMLDRLDITYHAECLMMHRLRRALMF